MEKEEKELRVGYLHQTRLDPYGGTTYRKVPKVQLSGVWLENLGFQVGDNIRVVAESGKITIERVLD